MASTYMPCGVHGEHKAYMRILFLLIDWVQCSRMLAQDIFAEGFYNVAVFWATSTS
jgi:hypothetical protein